MNISEVMKKYGIRPYKKLDQNFLIDKNIIKKEVELAEIKKSEIILEIGAGFGVLTEQLAKKAKKVIAVEKDPSLCKILKRELKNKNIEIIQGDILKVKLPKFDKCVSNIPYSLSSKITVMLGELKKPAILIYQKEFAERLVAEPGERDYSRISVMTQYYFTPTYLHTISKNCFFPKPKVDSAIIKLTPKRVKAKEEFFFKVVRSLFNHRNQKVSKAFVHSRHELGLKKPEAKKLSEKMPYKDKKVYTLCLNELAEISKYLSKVI